MKRDLLKERRGLFANTLQTTPEYFTSLNDALFRILNRDEDNEIDIYELKSMAKKAEKKAEELVTFSEELGFHLFQTYLLDNLEARKKLVKYIKTMPNATTTKTMKELRNLWQSCNRTIDFSAGMHFFTAQEDIANALSDLIQHDRPNLDKQQLLYEQVFSGKQRIDSQQNFFNDDVFGSNEFTEHILDDEEKQHKDAQAYKALIAAVNKTHVLTSKGYYVPKGAFRSGSEKLSKKDEDR